MKNLKSYADQTIVITTKHDKEKYLAPVIKKNLGARLEVISLDTDTLGTFTPEVERQLSPIECAKHKCLWGLESSKSSIGIATEGSFGPHPLVPGIAHHYEILYFIDREQEIEFYLTESTTLTNYGELTTQSYQDIVLFAKRALFPSHALILMPDKLNHSHEIHKGIQSFDTLHAVFGKVKSLASDGLVRVQPDMRAHLNPSRQRILETLGEKLSFRLTSICPNCALPGWGELKFETGLPCQDCGIETTHVQDKYYECQSCQYHEKLVLNNHKLADPYYCLSCNP